MSNCPVCDAPVKGDFGLVECEQCGAQLLVHVDGRVEYSGAQTGLSQADDHPLPPIPENDQTFDFGGGADEEFEVADATGASRPPVVGATPAAHDAYEEQPDFLPEEGVVPGDAEPLEEESAAPPEPMDMAPEEDPQVYKSPGTSDSPDLSDIAKFGNSENPARDGSLRYNLFVSGIDTVDVREEFREALTDRKFMWDIDQILKSIRHGEVRIAGVTPVKAYVLISRLRSLPVQVKWEQYAIQQT